MVAYNIFGKVASIPKVAFPLVFEGISGRGNDFPNNLKFFGSLSIGFFGTSNFEASAINAA